MASTQPIRHRQSNKKPLMEANRSISLTKNSDAETSATSFSIEVKLTAHPRDKQEQERLREALDQQLVEALDKELDALALPKLKEQAKRIPKKAKNLDWVPDSIVITNKDYDDDDESDNCSLISGLTLPQEISLLRQIADKHHHHHQESTITSSRHYKKSSGSKSTSSTRKTRNKVATNQISSSDAARRRKSRPTTDAGDLKPDRAQNMEIEIRMNGTTLTGYYSGALSHTVPRRPNGAGIIKFDNGDMYMGDMKDGQMHGHGTLVNGDTVLRGEFEHNMFVV